MISRDKFYNHLRPFVRFYTDLKRKKIMKSEFEIRFREFQIVKGDVIIDLGANRGDFTNLFSNFSCEIFAIEPSIEAFRYLVRRFRNSKNISCMNFAVAKKLEMRKLFQDRKQDIDLYISTFGKIGKETIYSVQSKEELEYRIETHLTIINEIFENGLVQNVDKFLHNVYCKRHFSLDTIIKYGAGGIYALLNKMDC